MALEFDKEDLKYVKSTIEWMLENMELNNRVRDAESLYNQSQNSIEAIKRGLAVGFNQGTANYLYIVLCFRCLKLVDLEVGFVTTGNEQATIDGRTYTLMR